MLIFKACQTWKYQWYQHDINMPSTCNSWHETHGPWARLLAVWKSLPVPLWPMRPIRAQGIRPWPRNGANGWKEWRCQHWGTGQVNLWISLACHNSRCAIAFLLPVNLLTHRLEIKSWWNVRRKFRRTRRCKKEVAKSGKMLQLIVYCLNVCKPGKCVSQHSNFEASWTVPWYYCPCHLPMLPGDPPDSDGCPFGWQLARAHAATGGSLLEVMVVFRGKTCADMAQDGETDWVDNSWSGSVWTNMN